MHAQQLPDIGLSTVRLVRAGERVVAGVPSFLVELFLSWAAMLPLLRWIDAVETFVPLNANAAKGMQSSDGRSTPIWSRGITGKGQVIAAADTVSSQAAPLAACFFACHCYSETWFVAALSACLIRRILIIFIQRCDPIW